MSINAIKDAIPSTGSQSYTSTRSAFAAGTILPLISSTAVTEFNTEDNAAESTLYLAVHYAGSVYAYDSGDTTSAHNPGAGVIVDGSGRRYIRDTSIRLDRIVKDKDLTTPPGSPTFADAYFVATGGTGDWASKDGEIAYYSDRGWIFETVVEGEIFYVVDETTYYYVNSSGALAQFPGADAIADDTIKTRHLESPFGCVVEAEQNTPPVSPTGSLKYIIGSSPTGDWVGHSAKVAEWNSSSWLFHTPKAGDFLNDKTDGYLKKYNGASWVRAVEEQPRLDVRLLYIEDQEYDNGGVGYGKSDTLTDYNLISIPVTGLVGQVIVFDFSKWGLEFKLDSGFQSMNTSFKFYVKKDNEVVDLHAEDMSGSVSTSYVSVITPLANFIRITDTIEDISEHNYHIGIRVNDTVTTSIADDVRLNLTAEFSRYAGTIQTS